MWVSESIINQIQDTVNSTNSSGDNSSINSESDTEQGNKVTKNETFEDIAAQQAIQVDHANPEKKEQTDAEVKQENVNLVAPLDWTDPIVWHDPTFTTAVIVKNVDEDLGQNSAGDGQQTAHKIDAIFFPLIKINQIILDNSQIVEFSLKSRNFLPELTLTIEDSGDLIKKTNSAGLDNSIVVIITCPINGVYKKIKLPFYIDATTVDGNYISYRCRLKFPKMYEGQSIEMNYPNKKEWPGCSSCKQSENKKPNTWELLHYIALECKLGFASTKQCKEIPDRRYRFFKGQYSDILPFEQERAGIDENNIFDFWVDVYGYLVMVNVPWVMNEKITTEHLSIYAIKGLSTSNTSQTVQDPQVALMNRTIFNTKTDSGFSQPHNLTIREYEIITNNELYDLGTLSTYRAFSPVGAGGSNGIDTHQIQIEEASARGQETSRYETTRSYMMGVEMCGDLKLLEQRSKVERYLQRLRAKQMRVVMQTCNLGLQRGTLVNVIITTDSTKDKAQIINAAENLHSVSTGEKVVQPNKALSESDLNDDNPQAQDYIQNQSVELPNQAISGLYYIDKISYDYMKGDEEIIQTLWLVKKGVWADYSTPNTYAKLDTIEMEPKKHTTP